MYSTTLPFFYGLSLMLSTGLGVISCGYAAGVNDAAPAVVEVKPVPPAPSGANESKGDAPIVDAQPLHAASSMPAPNAGFVEPQPSLKTDNEKKTSKEADHKDADKGGAAKDAPKENLPEFHDPVAGEFQDATIEQRKKADPATPATYIDTLEKALISAYLVNPEIREQRQLLRAADERVAQARAGWRPRVTGNASIGYEKQVFSGDNVKNARNIPTSSGLEGDRIYSRSVGVTLEQNIFNGGATVYATQSAEAAVKAARAALNDTEQKVLLAAIKAYLDLITKEAELEFLGSNENVLKKTLDATRDKFSVGEETRTSVAQAEGEHAASVARRQTAEAELEAIRATFIRVIGQAPGKLIMPPEPSMIPEKLDQAIEKSRLQNPVIAKAQFEEVSARREIDRVNSGLLPKLDLTGSSSATRNKEHQDPANRGALEQVRLTNDTVDHKVTLNLSIPLYEQGFTRSQKREALDTAEQKRVAIETARRQIEEAVITAWEAYQTAGINITSYKTQVRAGEVAVEGTRQEMQVGSKILLDVLNELRKLIDAQLQLVQERQRYYYNGYVVRQLMGMLTAQALNLNVNLYDPEVHFKETRYRFW